MKDYVFVNPATAPETNISIKAATYKKAIEKFKRKHPIAASGFRRGSSLVLKIKAQLSSEISPTKANAPRVSRPKAIIVRRILERVPRSEV